MYCLQQEIQIQRSFVWGCSQNCEKRLLSVLYSGCPVSVRVEKFGSQRTDCHEIWHLGVFRKYVEKIQVSLKFDYKKRILYRMTDVDLWYSAEFFLQWEMFRTKVVEKIKTHILCSVIFIHTNSCIFSYNCVSVF